MIEKVQEIDRFLMVSSILMFLLVESKVNVIKTTRVYMRDYWSKYAGRGHTNTQIHTYPQDLRQLKKDPD